MSPSPELFVVTGGVHAKVALALQALARASNKNRSARLLRCFQLATLVCFSVKAPGISLLDLRDTSIRMVA